MSRVVYLMSDQRGRLKIGKADQLDRRKLALEQEVGLPLVVIDTIPGSYALERTLHLECREWRLAGEWFTDCPEVRMAFAVAKESAGSSDAAKTDATIAAADAKAKAQIERDLGQIIGLVSGRTGIWGKEFALNYVADTYRIPFWFLRSVHYGKVTSPSAGVSQLVHDAYVAELGLMKALLLSHIEIMKAGGDPPFEQERAEAAALVEKLKAARGQR